MVQLSDDKAIEDAVSVRISQENEIPSDSQDVSLTYILSKI